MDPKTRGEIEKELEKRMKDSGSKKIKPKTNTTKTGKSTSTFERTPATDEADYAIQKAQEKYFKKGGSVKCKRDGCAVRGKTKGKLY